MKKEAMKSLNFILIVVLVFQLIILPIALDVGQAQQSSNSTIIAHQPVRLGYRGRPLNVVTNINDDVGVRRVSLVIHYGENTKTGNMPELSRGGKTPVQVSVLKDSKVYSGPSARTRLKGKLYRGELVRVTRVKENFYRILTDGGLYGYVESENLRVMKSGKSYGVSIPASLTNYPFISYQIVVTDAKGNISKSKMQKVRLLTQEEIAALRSKRGGSSSTKTASAKGGSSMTKYIVLAGLVALGGGAYYYATQQDDDEETTTVNVEVGWE